MTTHNSNDSAQTSDLEYSKNRAKKRIQDTLDAINHEIPVTAWYLSESPEFSRLGRMIEDIALLVPIVGCGATAIADEFWYGTVDSDIYDEYLYTDALAELGFRAEDNPAHEEISVALHDHAVARMEDIITRLEGLLAAL